MVHGVATRVLRRPKENLDYRCGVAIGAIRKEQLSRLIEQLRARQVPELGVQLLIQQSIAHLSHRGVIDLPAALGVVGKIRLWRYPILLPSPHLRDQCFEALWDMGLGPSKLYQRLLVSHDSVADGQDHWPNASSFCDRVLALPVHSGVGALDAAHIASVLRQQFGPWPETSTTSSEHV